MKRSFLWAVMALLAVMSVALARTGPKRAIAGTMSLVISDMGGDLATPINTAPAPAPADIGRAGVMTILTDDYTATRGAPDLAANGTNNSDNRRPRIRIYAGDSLGR